MLIISLKSGQLGNRLELFARIIAYAREKGLTVINPSFDEYASFFKYPSQSLFCHYPPKKSVLVTAWLRKLMYLLHVYAAKTVIVLNVNNSLFACVSLKLSDRWDIARNGLPNSSFVWLHGWKFRTKDLCTKHQEEIRRYFTPKDVYKNNIDKLFSVISQEYDLVIGIHVRQGDYRSFQGGRYYYSSEEYKSFIEQISSLFPQKRVRFLVCSNTVQNIGIFENLNIAYGSGHFIEDLYLLSLCKYLFGPPSTYTKWASFYGKVPLCVIENKYQSLQLSSCQIARL